MLAESLPNAPAVLSLDLRGIRNALLPLAQQAALTHNFGIMLEPRYIVGAERLDQ
jgi:hypothetical protein